MEENRPEELERLRRVDFTLPARVAKKYLIMEFPELHRIIGNRLGSLVGCRAVHTRYYHVIAFYKTPHECKACGATGLFMYQFNGTAREYCSHTCLNTSEHAWSKRRATTKARFGVDNVFASEQFKKKVQSTFEAKYGSGVTNPSQAESVKAKKRRKSISKYGVDHWMKAKDAKSRLADSYSSRYGEGVTNAMQVPGVVDRMRKSSQKKYGVAWASARPEVRHKVEQTNLKRYGVANAARNPGVGAKISASLDALWADTERAAEVSAKIRETFNANWGADHPSHNSRYRENNPGYKQYKLEYAGRVYPYQGYEGKVILAALERGLFVKTTGLPTIRWSDNRVYHPDVAVRNKKTGRTAIVEVKSTWTLYGVGYGKSLEKNLLKFKAANEFCRSRGWDFYLVLVERGELHWLRNPTPASVRRLIATVKGQ